MDSLVSSSSEETCDFTCEICGMKLTQKHSLKIHIGINKNKETMSSKVHETSH